MPLTPEAKTRLSQTIRTLRRDLLAQLKDHLQATYRLAVPVERAGLGEEEGIRRVRLERWLDERVRGCGAKGEAAVRAARERFLDEAVHEAAATLLNRLVYLRLLEHMRGPDGRPLRRMKLVTGGWSSEAMAEFRDIGGPLLDDEGEGFDVLLDLVFDDLSIDLPGLFGPVGVTPLVPVPIAALRQVVAALDDPVLAPAWDDDTTFGWVYQYWNDPKREALDEKIKNGGKIEPHEIASKTQMFTERYMVEWLLQNSLGPTWLAMCRKHGWTPDAERILPGLEARRAEWRAKREAGEVELDALMPIAEGLEDRWKYYVPQDVPEEAVAAAPATLRELKLLDPACGSGHFLVIACDLLFALYQEEARHRGTAWSDREIVEWIVADNLHGIDIDPRAVQIAAAALLLKARTLAPDCRPRTLNLVAPAFDLAGLPDDDPALVALLTGVEQETGLPQSLTRSIVRALAGADHLGTLLKVEHAVSEALMAHQLATGDREPTFDALDGARRVPGMAEGDAEAAIVERLETFLANHTGGPDLGLRLDGEQLAAGVRFMRLVRPGTYHVVAGNPPYQNTTRLSFQKSIAQLYSFGAPDLFAAFIERSFSLVRQYGHSAMVTMRSWLSLKQYEDLRQEALAHWRFSALCDVGAGGFDEIAGMVVSVSLTVMTSPHSGFSQVPVLDLRAAGRGANQKKAHLLAPQNTYLYDPRFAQSVVSSPIIYWWDEKTCRLYQDYPKIGDACPVSEGLNTGNNARFDRFSWEVNALDITRLAISDLRPVDARWMPLVSGATGRAWFEPLLEVVEWNRNGLAMRVSGSSAIRNFQKMGRLGLSFVTAGDNFAARAYRYASIFDAKGRSLFPDDVPAVLCGMNSATSKYIIQSISTTLDFSAGDVNRLPLFPIEGADEIYAVLDAAFSQHEAARETSVEFRRPGPSPWAYAQEWAQRAVDRPAGEPLPAYAPRLDPPAPVAWVSYAFGQAMGRFGRDGEGILDAAPADVLAHGILFL
ncbi:MAG: BREX-6 system adenine-specific DNA-methyltransferase PglX, partial [Caenispirillum sp.]|nr:BREX-6 system adenine-specific DNA-methyltransferase PglX [Caenispirillum sp.]